MDIQTLKETLIGRVLTKTIRVCDLIGLYFAAQNQDEDDLPYIHIQCWMRILQANRVLVSSEEMYLALDIENKEFQYDTDDSLFDEKMRLFVQEHGAEPITKIDAQENGDLNIRFADGCVIQILANSTEADNELWRFSLDSKTPHLICSGNGFELSDPS